MHMRDTGQMVRCHTGVPGPHSQPLSPEGPKGGGRADLWVQPSPHRHALAQNTQSPWASPPSSVEWHPRLRLIAASCRAQLLIVWSMTQAHEQSSAWRGRWGSLLQEAPKPRTPFLWRLVASGGLGSPRHQRQGPGDEDCRSHHRGGHRSQV